MRLAKDALVQVSDVDGTMIDEDDFAVQCAKDFREYWENTATLCSSILVYNTGRSIGQLTGLLEYRQGSMTVPDAIITAVGTKVFLLNRKAVRSKANSGSWCGPPCALPAFHEILDVWGAIEAVAGSSNRSWQPALVGIWHCFCTRSATTGALCRGDHRISGMQLRILHKILRLCTGLRPKAGVICCHRTGTSILSKQLQHSVSVIGATGLMMAQNTLTGLHSLCTKMKCSEFSLQLWMLSHSLVSRLR